MLSRGGHLESENILLVESRILGFGIQNKAQEIRNTTKALESGIQVALTRIGIQYLEWSIHGVESRIQGCLGFPHMGLLSLVLRLTAMNSAGSRREAGRAGPPYFFFSFLRPLIWYWVSQRAIWYPLIFSGFKTKRNIYSYDFCSLPHSVSLFFFLITSVDDLRESLS